MDIYERISAETAHKKKELDKKEKINVEKLKYLLVDHPVFTEIFITGDDSVTKTIYGNFHYEKYGPDDLSDRIDFLHHLIHYHIYDDGGYGLNPDYTEAVEYNKQLKIRVDEKCKELSKDEQFELRFEHRIRQDCEFSKKELPPMYTTFSREFNETFNGDGDDYDEILDNCKELYDSLLTKELSYRKRAKELFGEEY